MLSSKCGRVYFSDLLHENKVTKSCVIGISNFKRDKEGSNKAAPKMLFGVRKSTDLELSDSKTFTDNLVTSNL